MSATLAQGSASTILGAVRAGARLPPAVAYLLRVSAATILTFWLAFFLQLPTPYSAVTTVFIVANPVRGAIVSKSAWRLAGTVIGAIAAVVQFALFGQSPLLFFLFMAIWVGLCCAASTLLRFFASYGTVLAGYTIVIVDVGGFADPQGALLTALFRISVVALGIVVTGLVFLLTQSAPRLEALEARVAQEAVSLAGLVRDVLGGADLEAVRARRRDLSLGLAALEQSIVLAGSDSLDVRNRDLSLRYALTRLTGALSSGVHAAQRMTEPGDAEASDAARVFSDGLGAFINASPEHDRDGARRALAVARDRLQALMRPPITLDLLAAIDQGRETLQRLGRMLDDLDRSKRRAGVRLARLPRYFDWRSAARNGVRGALTVGLACVFWYVTEWPAGPTLLAYLVPAVALLSNQASPSAAALGFAQGTLAAVLMATIFQPIVLPVVTGFPLAVGLLLLFASPGVVGQLSPRWGGVAFSYLVFFNTNVALQNPMRFELAPLLNNDEAYLMGCAALLLVFRLLIPLNNVLVVDYLAVSVSRATRRLARGRGAEAGAAGGLGWENVQIQKILQMSDRLALMKSPRRAVIVEDAAAGLMVGRLVHRLRALAAPDDAPGGIRAAATDAIERIGRLGPEPGVDADAIEEEALRLVAAVPAVPPGSSDDAGRRRDRSEEASLRPALSEESSLRPALSEESSLRLDAAAMIHEAARLIRRHEAFFASRLSIG